jgi:hypothetical protein
LALGDIAINTYDGKAYIKKAIGSTQSIIQLGSGTGGSSVSASYALSSSYALNGGVTQLIAGTNVTLSPTDGKGAVTVNATISSSGSGSPNGPLYSLQFNNGGLFSGSGNFTLLGNNALYLTGSFNVSGSTFFTGSVSSLNGFTGSLFGTSSFAISASRAISSSYALSSSYAANGGVTQLLAGSNISLSPTNGLGQVTITSTGGSGGSGNTATGSYGSFYSTQTQTNVASTARSMSLNVTDITNGVSISGSTNPFNTYIKVQNPGVYDIQFSAQVDKTDSGTDEIWIWIRKNGTDISDSATSVELQGNGAHYVAAWNFFVNAAANDYFQLMWYSPDANVRLHAESAFGVVPGIPSLIVTANRVDQFLSNTGSFSGSFTGQLFGTSSWAVSASQAISSSYAVSSSYALSSSYSVSSSYALSSSYGLSSSFASTASYVATASYVPTLTQVTTAGNTTTNAITVGGLTISDGFASITKTTSGATLTLTPTASDNAIVINNSGFIKFAAAAVSFIRGFSGATLFAVYNSSYTNIFNLGTSAACYVNTGTNFLIGTTTDAGYKLDVNGTGRFSGNLTITGSASNSLLVKGSGATSSTTAVLVQNSSNTNLLTIRDDGNVRIGAGSPSFTLDVSGSGRFTNNLTVTGSALVTGSLTVSGSTTISDNLTVNGNATLNGTAVVISPPSIQLPGLTGAYSPSPSVRTVMFDTLNNALFITSSLPGGGAGTTTGSFTGSFTGSLLGTASFATFALGAGTANTASYVLNAVSSSFASTASFVVLAQTASYVTLAQTASFALNAVSASYAPAGAAFPYVGTARITGSLLVSGSITSTDTITSGLDVIANQNLKSMNQSGDEGGEIFLNVPATNTTIPGGVTIDVYQNRLRIFEQGGAANGYFLDMPSGGPGVSTDLSPAGYTGTVTILGNPPGQQNLNYTNGILISVT